ncbi:MAG: cell envelope integrity protein TolA [Gammaproteobacteria bacterium]|nr:cell envelope integrity protein TolA [Gammaproteobacteria bacterium]
MIGDFFRWLRAEAVPLSLALALHVALGLLLVLGKGFITAQPLDAPGRGAEHEPIEAVVVKESDFKAAQAQLEQAKASRAARVQELKEQAEQARKEREKAQQQLAEIKQQKQEAAEEAAARKEKLAQIKRQAQAAAEKREAAQAAAEKAKAEAEAARKAREAEQARIAKAKAKARAEAEERAKAKAAAERKAQMQAAMKEEAARHREKVKGNWVGAITAVVTGNWNRPLSTPDNLECRIRITQLSSGEVIGAEILDCNGGPAVRQSIKSAIFKSSPLPTPSDPAVFERQIVFDFIPGGKS